MVNQKLLQPQEIEVFYVLPTIRKYLATYMKENGRSQKEIASIFGVKESTISQYMTEKRANEVQFNEATKEEIKKLALNVKDTVSFIYETQKILRILRATNVLCQIHKKFDSNIPTSCSMKGMGCAV